MAQMVDNNREYIPTANTVGYYKLNGNANATTGSNGTATNVTWVDGKIGSGAGSFNGTSSYINGVYSLRNVTTFSLVITFKTTDITAFRGIYGVAYNGGSSDEKWVFRINTSGKLQLSDQVATTTDSNLTLQANTTYNVILIRKTSNTFALYINGVLDKEFTQTINTTGTLSSHGTSATLGISSVGYGQYWSGLIDEVIIENRAWTATEVADYYQQTKGLYGVGQYLGAGPSVTKGLYHLNGNCSDDSGNSNDGTPTNITYVPGIVGSQAASFNGTSSTIIATAPDYYSTQPLTISTWAKINALPTSTIPQSYICTWVENTIDSNTYDKGLLIDGSGRAVFHCYDGAVKESVKTGVSAGVWCHIVGVFTGSQIITYLNGEPGTAVNCSGTFNFTTPKFGFGSKDSTLAYTRFAGLIDETFYENRAWTASEIKKYYTYSKGKFASL